jgi:hypothetical protein
MIGLPRVVYVVIKGVSIESGEPQEEKIDGWVGGWFVVAILYEFYVNVKTLTLTTVV